MIVLGIETSCDETACAIVLGNNDRVQILSATLASSASIQAKYGGVIPEQAAREQLKAIIPVINEAFEQAHLSSDKLNAIAVTQGPGLIGSLLVGVETAKTLSLVWNKPLIPVNHLIAHFYGNWVSSVIPTKVGIYKIESSNLMDPRLRGDDRRENGDDNWNIPKFPCLGLLVSGGHTDLILMRDHGKYDYLGGTRDDAAGECFDKCARLLGLPYPGGPNLARLAEKGDPRAYKLPRPMINSGNCDFSFSGLKTAAANIVQGEGWRARGTPTECPHPERQSKGRTSSGGKARPALRRWLRQGEQDPEQQKIDLAASIQQAIIDVLIKKTIAAAKDYKIEQIMIAGGVAANQKLSRQLLETIEREIPHAKLFVPHPSLCTDNAVATSTAAYFNPHPIDPVNLQANPNLSLG